MNRLLLAAFVAATALAGRGVEPRAFVEDIVYRHTMSTGVWGGFRAKYDARLAANPADYEARILKAATYLGELVENPDLNALMRAYGGWFDPKTITFQGQLSFAGAPPSNAAVDRAAAVAIPALDAAEAELAQIPADWNGSFMLTPGDYPLDEPVRFDRGDLLALKAMLAGARAHVLYAQGTDCTMDNAKNERRRLARAADCPELGFSPTIDGQLDEWAGVPETFRDTEAFVAQAKAGSHNGSVFASFRVANADRLDDIWVDVGVPDPSTGRTVWDWVCLRIPLTEGVQEGRTSREWPYSVCLKGDVFEIEVKLPSAYPAAQAKLDIEVESGCRIRLADDPAHTITVDGDLSDWSGIQPWGGDEDDVVWGKVHRHGNEISVAFQCAKTISGSKPGSMWATFRIGDLELHLYKDYYCWDCDLEEDEFDIDLYSVAWKPWYDKYGNIGLYYKDDELLGSDVGQMVVKAKGNVAEIKLILPESLLEDIDEYAEGEEMTLSSIHAHVRGADPCLYLSSSANDEWSDLDRSQPSLREVMADNPDFMKKVRSLPKLMASRSVLRTAFNLLQAADGVFAARTDRVFHFFDYDPLLAPEQAKAREWVAEAKASLDAPQAHDLAGDLTWLVGRAHMSKDAYLRARNPLFGSGVENYFLGALFSGAVTRSKVPYVTYTGVPVLSSVPDFTVGGLCSSMNADRILGVAEDRAEFARFFTGTAWPGTVRRTAEAPIWMVKYVVGGGAVTYRADLALALKAKLACYVDGVLQPTTAYSGENAMKTIQLGAYGEHEIAWMFTSEMPQAFDVCPVKDIRGNIVDSMAWQNKDRAGLFSSPDTTEFAGDAVYNGWLRDANGSVVGVIEIKAARAANGRPSKVTGTVTWLATGKKEKLPAELVTPGAGATYQGISLGGLALSGSFRGYGVQGARDLSRSKDKAEKAAAAASLAAKAGVRTFALMTDAGFAAFTATVDKKGKCKFDGTLPDGTKVSYSGKGVLGENVLAVPLVFKRKASAGLVFWAYDEGAAEITDEAPLVLASGASYMPAVVAPSAAHRLADGGHLFVSEGGLGQSFDVAGRKWTFPKKDANPVALKMSFADRTGAVKGSYSVPEGKKKIRHTVFGVVVDDVMLGSAFIKKVGSCPVWTE